MKRAKVRRLKNGVYMEITQRIQDNEFLYFKSRLTFKGKTRHYVGETPRELIAAIRLTVSKDVKIYGLEWDKALMKELER